MKERCAKFSNIRTRRIRRVIGSECLFTWHILEKDDEMLILSRSVSKYSLNFLLQIVEARVIPSGATIWWPRARLKIDSETSVLICHLAANIRTICASRGHLQSYCTFPSCLLLNSWETYIVAEKVELIS